MTHDPPLTVYLPADPAESIIAAGSGIVGTPAHEFMPMLPEGDRLTIDYEGDLFGAANIVTYADRVLHAAGRHAAKYPTTARTTLSVEDLTAVGTFDGERVTIKRAAYPAVAEWIDVPEEELEAQLLIDGGRS